MDKQLLTLTEIAKTLKLAESTTRYYRDRFEEFIPSVGEGRKKRYKPETIDILKYIAEAYNRNISADEIKDGLTRMVAITVETADETAVATATVPHDTKDTDIPLPVHMQHLSSTLLIIAEQKEEIATLRNQLEVIEKRQQEQQKLIESLQEKPKTKKRWWFRR
ncbi:MerR family transcriptional regulator [Mesorhizobium sp. M7A.F.Ca.MR.362.00.0.0]|uniref:MerR family transcriptional regulator n=1 Tax=Mesorhizobium sp. M7A.F.Ca.MR.362.00.0.0 TaxID=2496779 RepID=UPI000FD34031|nr:MerR family transcriptional regulator [Mesorhizobium sp. M7A.F.Ca.MR.362.00.0.0]RUU72760.1 MerR family transcriptional regulator [Mesorhizobium sp. M7A.F.Ca.MR.362.00.0.0]